MNKTTGFAAHNNARLYYELDGNGPQVIFIHAGVADHRQWNNEFDYFKHNFRVLRYDMRGYGKSLPVDETFSHMDDLNALLLTLKLREPYILLGCSMGGGLALDYALENPTRVKALIMVGSAPTGLELEVHDHPKEAEALKAYQDGDLDRLAELEAQIWFDGMNRTPQQVNQEMRNLAIEMNRLALMHERKKKGKRLADTKIKAVHRLSGLTVPLLLVNGEHDIPYIHAAAEIMLTAVPSARKVVINDAAHLANMDQPDQFRNIIETFFLEIN